jgi:hypothetical protein
MVALICFVLAVLASPLKSKSRLEAENAVLRHQLIDLQRKVRGRAHLTNNDRGFFIRMYRWFPSILKVVTIVEPETLVRWHRAGFRCDWRWKSRSRGAVLNRFTFGPSLNVRAPMNLGTQMFTAAECRAIALAKITQAKHDKRHGRKLISAAEAWSFLARKMDEFEGVVAVAFEVDDDADIDYRAA